MKNNKVFSFLRSMRFGMILLCAIAALSVVGTLITQGQTAAFYPERYGNWGNLILFCGFDHMYATWYYVCGAVPEPAALLGAAPWQGARREEGAACPRTERKAAGGHGRPKGGGGLQEAGL